MNMPKRLLNKSDLKPLPKGFKKSFKEKNIQVTSINLSNDDVSTRIHIIRC